MSDTAQTATDREERHGFEAEVSKLLKLMVHSVYSEREVFLRELISNAADACDKLRYQALTDDKLTGGDSDYRIIVKADPKEGTLTVSDNGIGMSRQDLIDNLGTVARSGTAAFLDQLTGESKKDLSLIGQFGVGFYSSFMVADTVRVVSRAAGSNEAWSWHSDGQGEFVIQRAKKPTRGTAVTLTLKEDAKEFVERQRLEQVIKTYSDHIAFPILLTVGDEATDDADRAVNDASALWTRDKSDISDEQYREFYRHCAHAFDEPALTLHWKAEGMIEYRGLIFIPSQRPIDLFEPARKPRVKLYVKRVFITDQNDELIPGYLRFLRGVIDSEDLPLNISREMLQNNPVVRRIRKSLTTKVLAKLEECADTEPDRYLEIWDAFGPVLKEGIYEDEERRHQILKLARFRSTAADNWTTLADYVSRMKDEQSAIYYVTGPSLEAARRSPQLEGFVKRDLEVLLLSDPVDDFWLSAVHEFNGTPLKSVTRGRSDLADISETDSANPADNSARDAGHDKLIAVLKEIYGEEVKDVRVSGRLTESAACLVADEQGPDLHLERILKMHQQLNTPLPKILEINPGHALIQAIEKRLDQNGGLDAVRDAAMLVLDQARIVEGEELPDPSAFARRLANAVARGLQSG